MSGTRNIMHQKRQTATLFIDNDSWLQILHPFTKLSYILLTGTLAYALAVGWKFPGILILVNLCILLSAGLLVPALRALLHIMLPLALFMILIHSFLNPENSTVLFSYWGLVMYQEGLFYALNTLAKLTVILLTSLLFVFSTHPADLIISLSQNGKSPSLAYLIGSPLLLLAGMRQRVKNIQAVQQARGLDSGGNVITRVFSLAPLILPLVTGAIMEVEQRAIALEVRGFKATATKTSLRTLPDSRLQRFLRWLMLVSSLTIIISKLVM